VLDLIRLTFLFHQQGVDGVRTLSRRLLRLDDAATNGARHPGHGIGVQVEGSARLHNGSRRSRADSDAVRLRIVAGQVGLELELLATIDNRTSAEEENIIKTWYTIKSRARANKKCRFCLFEFEIVLKSDNFFYLMVKNINKECYIVINI